MTIEKAEAAEAAWLIELAGELDARSAPRFRSSLDFATPPAGDGVVLDLSELSFLDSAGLAAIVALYLQLDDAGARLAVVSGSRHITRMFNVTDVRRLIDVTPTRAGAMASLRS